MTAPIVQAAPTVGEIARRYGVHVHQVEYVIRSRGIQPAATAGNARVFAEPEVQRIMSELARISATKEGKQ